RGVRASPHPWGGVLAERGGYSLACTPGPGSGWSGRSGDGADRRGAAGGGLVGAHRRGGRAEGEQDPGGEADNAGQRGQAPTGRNRRGQRFPAPGRAGRLDRVQTSRHDGQVPSFWEVRGLTTGPVRCSNSDRAVSLSGNLRATADEAVRPHEVVESGRV